MSPSPEDVIVGLSIGEGGWVTAKTSRGWLHVRFELGEADRLEPVELHLTPSEPIGTAVLRRLPLASLVAMANAPGRREGLTRRVQIADPPGRLRALAEAELVAHLEGQLEAADVVSGRLGPIPPGRGKPDRFYRRVAHAYLSLAVQTNRPAVVLAAVNGVPVSRVHGWVKEARRRGFLAPGQKGKRG